MLHYPPFDGTEEPGPSAPPPTKDINLLTMLPAANEPGLQVKGSDWEWMDVPCDFGTLIINIGDMLQEASRGYYPPPPTASSTRPAAAPQVPISLPLFLHPAPGRGALRAPHRPQLPDGAAAGAGVI